MSQVLESPLEAGRDAVRRRDWEAAYPLLHEADTAGDLAPEDLELLAEAALWGGRFEDYMDASERAYKGYVDAGNLGRAAYMATLLAHDNRAQLQNSVASGWLARAKRHLDETDEAPEHGYWALQRSLVALGEHDFDEAFGRGRLRRTSASASKTAASRSEAFSARAQRSWRRARSRRASCSSTRRVPPRSAASSTRTRPSSSIATPSARAVRWPTSTRPRSGPTAPPSSATPTPCPPSRGCAA